MPVIAIAPCSRLHDYEASVRRAGGEVRILDPRFDAPAEVVRSIDGLLLAGGHDIDPALYGDARHEAFVAAEPGRDAFELALARETLTAGRPLLAICRGMQILNVARGGTLVQDIPSDIPTPFSHRIAEPLYAIAHDIRVAGGSVLARLLVHRLADQTCAVNSRHHQAIRIPGAGLAIAATAPDGVIEAVEDPAQPFCVGVQWHPENFYRTGEFRGLFEGFVQAADR